MDKKTAFDLAKKMLDHGDINTGYQIEESQKVYNTHFTNSEWKEYLNCMQKCYPDAFDQFDNCLGGEIKEYYDKRWNQRMPPKMASFGSSSRFIFEISRTIPTFKFEEELPIGFTGYGNREAKASLDGYLESKGVFVEAKCHEFYTSHTTIFKKQYKGFYQYLQDKTNGFFKYYVDSNKKTPTVSFSWNNTPITQFDLKQVLCHLLGIAKKTINEKGKQIPTLVYLIYKPSEELLDNVESIDCKQTADAIKRCWGKELEEINTINATGFGLLYNCVVHFLCDEKGIGQELLPGDLERIAKAFQFKLCDQDNYSSTVN